MRIPALDRIAMAALLPLGIGIGTLLSQQSERSLEATKLSIRDAQGKERIVLSASPEPSIAILDEAGNPALLIGIAGEDLPYGNASLKSPFVKLIRQGSSIALGFEAARGKDTGGASLQMAFVGEESGMMSRLFTSSQEASLCFVELLPFPFPRLMARALAKDLSVFETRDEKGEVVFSTKQK